MIRKIYINRNWFYYQIHFETLPNILKDNAILSKRLQGDNTITSNAWNGLDYISLSKKDKNYIWKSSYRRFISPSYAFIFNGIEAIETEYVEDDYEYYRLISNLSSNKRYSIYEDEYQIKNKISLDKVIGIKIPNVDINHYPREFHDRKDCAIDEFLKIIDGKMQVPFIDIDNELQIDRKDIKRYLLERWDDKMNFKEIIHILQLGQKTIATMESCTGGGVVNAITNCEGASEVLKFSAVTYSNEYKVKMGVPKEVIDKYTVYSMETAIEMSKAISSFANSNYGIGITGKLNKSDPNNPCGDDNTVYICIYDRDNDKFYKEKMTVNKESRALNKEHIIDKIITMLLDIIK